MLNSGHVLQRNSQSNGDLSVWFVARFEASVARWCDNGDPSSLVYLLRRN